MKIYKCLLNFLPQAVETPRLALLSGILGILGTDLFVTACGSEWQSLSAKHISNLHFFQKGKKNNQKAPDKYNYKNMTFNESINPI